MRKEFAFRTIQMEWIEKEIPSYLFEYDNASNFVQDLENIKKSKWWKYWALVCADMKWPNDEIILVKLKEYGES